MFKKFLPCLLLISGLIFAHSSAIAIELTLKEQQWLDAHPVIRVGSDRDYAPLEMYKDGEFLGLSADYIALFQKAFPNTKFQFVEPPESWDKTLEQAKNKQIDLVSMMKMTPDRLDYFNFTSSYIDLDSAIIASKANKQITNFKSLKGKKVAVVESYFWHDLLMKNYPGVEIVTVPTLAKGLERVAFGSADAMLATFATATNYIQEQSISNLHVVDIAPYKTDYGMAVRKDWPELASILDKVIKEIPPETHQAMKAKWVDLEISGAYIPEYQLKWIYVALGALLFLAAFLAVVGHLLSKQVDKRTRELKEFNDELKAELARYQALNK